MLYNVKEYGLYTGTTGDADAAVTLGCSCCRSLDVTSEEARLVVDGVELVTATVSVTTELLPWSAAVAKFGRLL